MKLILENGRWNFETGLFRRTSSVPWFFEGVGGFPLSGGQQAREKLGGTGNVDENKTA